MINCYIVDDEPSNVDALLFSLKNNHPELEMGTGFCKSDESY